MQPPYAPTKAVSSSSEEQPVWGAKTRTCAAAFNPADLGTPIPTSTPQTSGRQALDKSLNFPHICLKEGMNALFCLWQQITKYLTLLSLMNGRHSEKKSDGSNFPFENIAVCGVLL